MTAPLRHVLWLGGPPGSGKTTVATRLARRHGLRWYCADTRTWEHRDRALAAGNAAARRWEELEPGARGSVSDEELLVMSLHRERGAMVVDDVRALPGAPLLVAEGSTVPPWVVSSGAADAARALWLLPAPGLRCNRVEARSGSGPHLRLYDLVAAELERETAEHGAPTLLIDGSLGIAETVAAVEERFADALRAGPRAETRAERRLLVREANLAIVEQLRRFHARPWASGDAETTERTFLCECGETGCEADVTATVGAAAAGPLVAAAHG